MLLPPLTAILDVADTLVSPARGSSQAKPDSVDITEVLCTGGGAGNTCNCLSKNVLEQSFKKQLK